MATLERPKGWRVVGNATLSPTTDPRYAGAGERACRVDAVGAGSGIRTIDVPWEPTAGKPYASLYVTLSLLQGAVEVRMVDGEGTPYPTGETNAESNERTLTFLTVEAEKPPAGTLRAEVLATESGTTFVADSVCLVQRASAVEYQPFMGGKALWKAGARFLARESSRAEDGDWRASVWTVSPNAFLYDRLEAGDQVHVQEPTFVRKQTGGNSTFVKQTLVGFSGRIQRVVERFHEPQKKVSLARQAPLATYFDVDPAPATRGAQGGEQAGQALPQGSVEVVEEDEATITLEAKKDFYWWVKRVPFARFQDTTYYRQQVVLLPDVMALPRLTGETQSTVLLTIDQ